MQSRECSVAEKCLAPLASSFGARCGGPSQRPSHPASLVNGFSDNDELFQHKIGLPRIATLWRSLRLAVHCPTIERCCTVLHEGGAVYFQMCLHNMTREIKLNIDLSRSCNSERHRHIRTWRPRFCLTNFAINSLNLQLITDPWDLSLAELIGSQKKRSWRRQ